MANYQIIKRLETIVHLLNGFPNLSKKELLQRLQHDYDITATTRTLERDFKALDTDFGIELVYNRERDGYALHEEGEKRAAAFLKFMARVHMGEIFKQGLQEFKDLQEVVSLEDYSRFRGINLVQPILLAIKQKRQLVFTHENYSKNTFKKYEISPFQLKEYLNRWYVVGIPQGEQHIKTYGLDRIDALKITGLSSLQRENYETQLEKFRDIIGLNYDAAENREMVELWVSQHQYKYLESLPLHRSQKKNGIAKNNWVRVELHLIINYEFKMQLFKLSDQVEVVSPSWLRQELKTTLKQTLKLYTDEQKR